MRPPACTPTHLDLLPARQEKSLFLADDFTLRYEVADARPVAGLAGEVLELLAETVLEQVHGLLELPRGGTGPQRVAAHLQVASATAGRSTAGSAIRSSLTRANSTGRGAYLARWAIFLRA
jgi:hypothetical protein